MTDALQPRTPSPEALAIISQGEPKPQSQTSLLATAKPEKALEQSGGGVAPAKATVEPPAPAKARVQKPNTEDVVSFVPFSCRVPASIPPSLLRASADRKAKRIRPYTHQDIVAEALTDWLLKNGYPE